MMPKFLYSKKWFCKLRCKLCKHYKKTNACLWACKNMYFYYWEHEPNKKGKDE